MKYFLGVDIGTTSVKAIAFNEIGILLHKYSVGYEMQHPQPGYSEQNVYEIYTAVILSINKVAAAMLPEQASFISFSCMMHSLIAVDEKGEPITACIIWADNRAAGIAERLRRTEQGQNFYHLSGVPIHAMSPLCKLLWMKDNHQQVFKNAYKYIGIKEFIFFKLFGKFVVDTALASATGLLNIISLQWDKTILKDLQLSEEKLSTVVGVDSVFYYENQDPGTFPHLSAGMPFVIGGSDGALANLGIGSTAKDSVAVTVGTSAAIRILSNTPVSDPDMSTFCYHALDKQYIIGGASNNGAIVLQWIKESLLQTRETFEELFKLADSVPAGTEGLFLVPYILGERAPVWNAEAKGIYFGLTINHTKAHLVRAAMEGVIYNLYLIGKQLLKGNRGQHIFASGGFAQNSLWLQILADVFYCKVLVSGSPEASALGAVMVGEQALLLPRLIQPTIVSEYEPNPVNHEIYQKGFRKFETIYDLFKSGLGDE